MPPAFGTQVSFADYEGIEGIGTTSAEEVYDLAKALRAGQQINPPASAVPGDGFTLKPESLERTLYNVTFRMEHVKLWRALDKTPAFNTVEEFSRLLEYGNGIAAFIQEGELPSEQDSTYERAFDVVKYMGTTRRVTHVMQTVRTHIGNAVAQETVNGTMWLLERIERSLFYGNAQLVPEEFDGIFTLLNRLLPVVNNLDLRNQPLSQDFIEEGSHIVSSAPNYGMATDLWMSMGVYSDVARTFYPTQRSPLPPSGDGTVGFVVDRMRTQNGLIRFNPDVFVQPGQPPVTAGVGDTSKRPAPPTLGTGVIAAPGAGEVSLFTADDAGDYRYRVAMRNRFGISTPVDVNGGTPITVAAGDKVNIPITVGSPAGTAIIIYRSEKNGSLATAREMTQVPVAAPTTTVGDLNNDLPGTTMAAMLQQNRESWLIKQLAPMTRLPLAQIDTSTRWAQVIYLVLTLHTPRKNILFRNIGRIEGTRSPFI
jgi:hypothetical protein